MVTRRQVPILEPYQLHNYLAKIDIRRDTSVCWNWTGAKVPKGNGLFYGTFKNCRKGVQHNVHLWAYRYFVGPLNLELELAHTCLNGLCCNWVEHLVETDHSTNQYMTMDPRFGPGKYCNNGHERLPENTYVDPRDWRECALCRIDAVNRYQMKEVMPL